MNALGAQNIRETSREPIGDVTSRTSSRSCVVSVECHQGDFGAAEKKYSKKVSKRLPWSPSVTSHLELLVEVVLFDEWVPKKCHKKYQGNFEAAETSSQSSEDMHFTGYARLEKVWDR